MSGILCVDIGTSSLKACVIENNGTVKSFSRISFSSNENGFAALQWISALADAVSEAEKCGASFDGIAVSGNGPSLVAESGRTLLWNDEIPHSENPDNSSENHSLFIPRIKAFKSFFSEDYEKTRWLLSGPEFLIYKLTGNAVTILPEKRFESAYWNHEMLLESGLSESDEKKLPSFVNIAFNAGNTTEEMQKKFGLKKAVPVFTGGPDFVMALVGTNTLKSGKICDRSGSSEGINYCASKPFFSDGIRTLPSVIPGLWNMSVLIPESGSLLDRFREEINAIQKKENSWEEILDYAFGDKNSEGFHDIMKISGKVRKGVELLKKCALENGLPFDDKMTVTGGQAKNEKWLKEKALLTGIDLCIMQLKDGELLGDAVCGFTGMKIFNSIEEAAEKLVKIEKRFSLNDRIQSEPKIYKIPEKIKTIIFDIDSTLYTSLSYAIEQVDVQIRCIAEKRGITNRQARNEISEFRRKWSLEHEGKKISLGNTLTHFGVSIDESIKMRRELLEPKNFLGRDEKLIFALKELKEHYNLICVTNNPVLPARKTLEAIGISEIIPEIIGLDTCGKSKPAREPFELAARKTGAAFEECLAVGDRYDMDISLPLEMGMGGYLVTGVKDVHTLPVLLKSLGKF